MGSLNALKRPTAMLVAAVALFTSGIGLAMGKIVFDPTNFGKNLITAAQSVKQTAQMAMQYKTMVDQYMTMLTNVKQLSKTDVAIAVARGVLPATASQAGEVGGMPSSDAMGMAKGVYTNYDDLHQTMNGLSQTYDDLQQYSMNMSRQSVQTGKSWEDILALELKQAKQGQIASAQQYNTLQGLVSQLKNFQTRADRLAGTIPQNEGAVQMLGTISAQNHLVTDQLSGVLQASVAQAEISSTQARDAALDKEDRLNALDAAEKRHRNALQYLNPSDTKTGK